MNKITRDQFAKELAKETELSQTVCKTVINSIGGLVQAITDDEEAVEIPGLGTFSLKINSARKGRNPSTGEPMDIAESRGIRFKMAPKAKQAMNKKA